MLDEKILAQGRKRTEMRIKEGLITRESNGRFAVFFMNNAKNSLESAKLLFDASVNPEMKRKLGLADFKEFARNIIE